MEIVLGDGYGDELQQIRVKSKEDVPEIKNRVTNEVNNIKSHRYNSLFDNPIFVKAVSDIYGIDYTDEQMIEFMFKALEYDDYKFFWYWYNNIGDKSSIVLPGNLYNKITRMIFIGKLEIVEIMCKMADKESMEYMGIFHLCLMKSILSMNIRAVRILINHKPPTFDSIMIHHRVMTIRISKMLRRNNISIIYSR